MADVVTRENQEFKDRKITDIKAKIIAELPVDLQTIGSVINDEGLLNQLLLIEILKELKKFNLR